MCLFIFHQVTGALSEGISTVHNDSKHNMKRQQIRSSATSSGSQFMSGLRGLGLGLYGGVKSIAKPFEGAVHGGIEVCVLHYNSFSVLEVFYIFTFFIEIR